jgi:exopolysaccharide biosynthesis predicted pyruvyltransferase EpsI
LEGFFESDFIVTDSFHGVVFSILFNKPFFVIGNHARGLARIYSLTKMFGLGERIVFSVDDLKCETINSHINFDKINKILQIKRLESLDFLKRSLV